MAFNGSGVFNRLYNWVNDAAASIKIRADRMDAEMNGFATGLSTCITKDGQTTITANLPMATYRHTGVGAAVNRTDYARFDQLQDGNSNWVDGGGTADAITAAYSIPITTLVDGQLCFVRATAANATTTPTFSPSGLTARTIVKNGGQALVAGDISGDGHELILRYLLASTRWELLNPAIPTASETVAGKVELSTDAEAQTGTDTARAITPANLQAVTATETRKGVVELATDAEAQTGTDTARAITPANLQAVTATDTRKGVVEKATQAEMEAETSDKYPDASVLKYHPGVAKGWAVFPGSSSVSDSYNISSVTDNGTGDYTINIGNDMASSNYAISGICQRSAAGNGTDVHIKEGTTPAAGSFRITTANGAGTNFDPGFVSVTFHGDLA